MKRHYRHKETGQKFPAISDIVPEAYDGCPADVLEIGAARGNYVHKATVLLDQDNFDISTAPVAYRPFCEAYLPAVASLRLKYIKEWTERPAVSELLGVAGTTDRVGTVGGRLTRTIIDIKTGDHAPKKLKALWGLRLAGYELIYRDVEQFHGRMDRLVVQLHSTGKFTPYPLDDPSDHAAFKAKANSYKWDMSRGFI